ncbi:MAG: sarcosine oxidase subunit gamma [Rhodobacteraceae bacterium]|jgi:sarcosine oxidase subunit gamma|nr:sarcosine oxidase subunit gamma [Paracoccaceae bacterium]
MAEVTVAPLTLPGMVTLKADLADARVQTAVQVACGQATPARLGAALDADGHGALWMAPDELLLLVPDATATVAALQTALAGLPHLAADVSDMRVGFRLTGPGARAVLARLSPADLSAPGFGPGMVRRTRLAQVPCAVWMVSDAAVDVAVFRSVADYASGLLRGAVDSEVRAPLI